MVMPEALYFPAKRLPVYHVMLWSETRYRLVLFALAASAAVVLFWQGILELNRVWSAREEYSHAYFVPLLAVFFAWQRLTDLSLRPLSGSWWGMPVVLFGVALFLLGSLSAINLVVQIGFLVALTGLVLAWLGWEGMQRLWPSLFLLFLIIPLPQFLISILSLQLQLLSTDIGVAFIRMMDISVFVEGNVIDLGSYKLQVVEACSGLNYLFPLLSIGFIVAYMYDGPMWQRIVIFLSSAPITVLINSFRIGLIGVTVEYWGIEMAEGVLHDFEGWVLFMVCTAILVLEVWLFWRFSGSGKKFSDVFGIYLPARVDTAGTQSRKLPKALVAAFLVLVAGIAVTPLLENREATYPPRVQFSEFPYEFGDWQARRQQQLDSIILDELNTDDYYFADFRSEGAVSPINLHMTYYTSQKSRASVHSPRACLPGGGWGIDDIQQHVVKTVVMDGEPLQVNRVQMVRGKHRQLVYYWFPQRHRNLTNEYLVRWYIFYDSLIDSRSDGALVRLITPLTNSEDWTSADDRLSEFAADIVPELRTYIPD